MPGNKLPSPGLIHEFFEANSEAALDPKKIMAYQRMRIKNSCNRHDSNFPPTTRFYTATHRGGMAVQGSLIFVLGQAQGPNFDRVSSNLRTIVELETLPDDYDPDDDVLFTYEDGSELDGLSDAFRGNVDKAICDFCPRDEDFPCPPVDGSEPRIGDSGDGLDRDGDNKCKQDERDVCCSRNIKMSWFQQKEVCDLLGCNLKKCGKRDASESSEDTITVWKGDEWSGDEDPTASPVWKGDEWGSASPTKKPTNDPTMDPTKKPSRRPTRKVSCYCLISIYFVFTFVISIFHHSFYPYLLLHFFHTAHQKSYKKADGRSHRESHEETFVSSNKESHKKSDQASYEKSYGTPHPTGW